MKGIIDRFENEFAVIEIEVGKTGLISKQLVPDAQEGDIINIQIEKKQTMERRKQMEKLAAKVFEDENEI